MQVLFWGLLSGSVVADTVTLYLWEEYRADETVATFQQQSGHTVKQVFFDDESTREHILASGRGQSFDLVILDSITAEVFAQQGRIQSFSPVLLDAGGMLDPRWQRGCGEFGVPYAWGTTGILYRESVSKDPIRSWMQLFSPPAEHQQRVVMYDEMIDSIGVALLALGKDPFSEEEADLKAAYALMQQQRSALLAAELGLSYGIEQGAESQMSLALGYAGENETLAEATGQSDWQYVVPNEGTLLWLECWAAPAGRPLSKAAQAFLAFLNQPEQAASNAEAAWIATPNRAAVALTSAEYRADSGLFPSSEVMARSHAYKHLSPKAMQLRLRIIHSLQ